MTVACLNVRHQLRWTRRPYWRRYLKWKAAAEMYNPPVEITGTQENVA
jgi:hypothetical protein